MSIDKDPWIPTHWLIGQYPDGSVSSVRVRVTNTGQLETCVGQVDLDDYHDHWRVVPLDEWRPSGDMQDDLQSAYARLRNAAVEATAIDDGIADTIAEDIGAVRDTVAQLATQVVVLEGQVRDTLALLHALRGPLQEEAQDYYGATDLAAIEVMRRLGWM